MSNASVNRLDYIYHDEKLTIHISSRRYIHFPSHHFFAKHSSIFGCGHIPTYSCIPYTFNILLMEENLLHHLGCTKPCKQLDKLPTSTGDHRISPISNSILKGFLGKWYGNSMGRSHNWGSLKLPLTPVYALPGSNPVLAKVHRIFVQAKPGFQILQSITEMLEKHMFEIFCSKDIQI